MITFLRQIRHALMASGNTRKYLLYAVGEIALVVIGILIALQINNWNQNRINGREEQRILKSVADEMDTYRWQTERGRKTYNNVLASADRLLSVINDASFSLPRDSVDADLAILTSRWLLGQSNQSNIYDALTGSGELGIITLERMRALLEDLKSDFLLLASYETYQTAFVDNQLRPFMNRHLDGLHISDIRSKVREERFGYIPKSAIPSTEISAFATDYEALLSSQYFSNLLVEHMRHTSSLLPIYGRLSGYVTEIDSLLVESLHNSMPQADK